MLRVTAVLAVAAAAALVGSPALAANVLFKSTANAAGVVPPTTATGTCALTATYGTVGKRLVGNVNCTGLSGDITAVSINGPATATENAPALLTLTATAGRAPINVVLTDAQWEAVNGEKTYLLVSTAANPNGEVRGLVDRQ